MKDKKSLVFVYNAKSGLLDTIIDYAHKMVSPSTYPCNLCALTFNTFGMKNQWKAFIDSLPVDVEFLHKNEFLDKYKMDGNFPSAYMKNKDITLFISQEEMNSLKTLDELMKLVKKKL
jgi:hypothetical protein